MCVIPGAMLLLNCQNLSLGIVSIEVFSQLMSNLAHKSFHKTFSELPKYYIVIKHCQHTIHAYISTAVLRQRSPTGSMLQLCYLRLLRL